MDPGPVKGRSIEDGIDLVSLFLTLWRRKAWILAGTGLVTAAGLIHAFTATPVYHAQATISPKETEKGGDASRLLSQFGGMGGMVASQLGMGNTNLDKIEIILKGHELAEAVITRNNLMPVLFAEKWNAKDSAWLPMDSAGIPTLRDGMDLLKDRILTVTIDAKKNILRTEVEFPDPLIAKQLVDNYLTALNDKIRSDVKTDAERNYEYLERQMFNTPDPVLKEKIQNMISYEIEKIMLVSSQSFDILEKPMVPMRRSKPNRKLIVMLALLIGALGSTAVVFGWSWSAELFRTVRRAHGLAGNVGRPDSRT